MVLSRWQPLGELHHLHNEVNRLFNQFGTGGAAWPALARSYPGMNVWEDENNIYAEAELPGMTQEQLEVYVTDGNQLTLQGERKPGEHVGLAWHRHERGTGKFSRTLALPTNVDADRVEAKLEAGIIHLTLPKSAAARPRKIAVQGE